MSDSGDRYNFDICPECDSDLDVVESKDERDAEEVRPLQGHRLECENCDHTTTVAILHYPDERYIGIWEAHDEECDCGNTARYGIERMDDDPLYQCGYCAYDLFAASYIDVVRLL